MSTWHELKRHERLIIIAFIVIVLALIFLAWYGYFTGAWENIEVD